MKKLWPNPEMGFYYDEEQDKVYINEDYLTDLTRLELITIKGYELRTEKFDDGEELYYLLEVRYDEGDVFEERFKTVEEAFDRLSGHFDDTLYEWVTNGNYAQIWLENQEAC